MLTVTHREQASTFGPARAEASTGLRSGIIGLGFIGRVHARAVREAGGNLAAVADAGAESIDDLAAQLRG